jgi:hypothetical protein
VRPVVPATCCSSDVVVSGIVTCRVALGAGNGGAKGKNASVPGFRTGTCVTIPGAAGNSLRTIVSDREGAGGGVKLRSESVLAGSTFPDAELPCLAPDRSPSLRSRCLRRRGSRATTAVFDISPSENAAPHKALAQSNTKGDLPERVSIR